MSICTLTDSAKKQIDTICQEHNAIAVTLNMKGGGCAGFEYDWGTISDASEIEEGDEIIATGNGFNFIIGAHSLMFMIGTVVDYKKDIMGSMFEITNPNAQSSCGCGVSINFDMDKLSTPAI
jgi:iron-sulfur cluster assembly accessory protein